MLVAKGLLRHEKELEAWIATGEKSTDLYKQIVSEVMQIRQILIQKRQIFQHCWIYSKQYNSAYIHRQSPVKSPDIKTL